MENFQFILQLAQDLKKLSERYSAVLISGFCVISWVTLTCNEVCAFAETVFLIRC